MTYRLIALFALCLSWRAAVAEPGPVPREELESAIAAGISKVPELVFLRAEAERLGLHAWLFGGTAAGYAHYVNWNELRKRGDGRFQNERFDFDYTNIYRSTQDLDLVVDGPPGMPAAEIAEKAEALRASLAKQFPHFMGTKGQGDAGKSVWEVRLLRHSLGDKEAILDNPDFRDQHTDSNSTGLIEVTVPKASDPVVRDVRDWHSRYPHFFEDVRNGRLHYYYSEKHGKTRRAASGLNPPIFSAIRFLTKAFQYELAITDEDKKWVEQVIKDFDPERDLTTDYARAWLEKNGKKLFQHAVNIEYAWDTIEAMGLRKKLLAFGASQLGGDGLANWMERQPLRSFPLGRRKPGDGETAGELKLDVVAHDTRSFLAYESITRAHTGEPNVFITAYDEPGFYTLKGHEGAFHTGLCIRFKVDPRARLGVDFVIRGGEYIFKNKKALTVIPESLNVPPVDFFRLLATFKREDWGVVEKLKRRIAIRLPAMQGAELGEILSIVRAAVAKPLEGGNPVIIREWFSLPFSRRYPDILETLAASPVMPYSTAGIFEDWLSHEESRSHPEIVQALLARKNADAFSARLAVWSVLNQTKRPFTPPIAVPKKAAELVDLSRKLVAEGESKEAVDVFIEAYATGVRPRGGDDEFFRPGAAWEKGRWGVDIMNALIRRLDSASDLLEVLVTPYWAARKEGADLVKRIFARDMKHSATMGYVLMMQDHWAEHERAPELLRALMGTSEGRILAVQCLTHPIWGTRKEGAALLDELIDEPDTRQEIAYRVLNTRWWAENPRGFELLTKLMRDKGTHRLVMQFVLPQDGWRDHPRAMDIVKLLLDNPQNDYPLQAFFERHHDWERKVFPLLNEEVTARGLRDYLAAHGSFPALPPGDPGAARCSAELRALQEARTAEAQKGWAQYGSFPAHVDPASLNDAFKGLQNGNSWEYDY